MSLTISERSVASFTLSSSPTLGLSLDAGKNTSAAHRASVNRLPNIALEANDLTNPSRRISATQPGEVSAALSGSQPATSSAPLTTPDTTTRTPLEAVIFADTHPYANIDALHPATIPVIADADQTPVIDVAQRGTQITPSAYGGHADVRGLLGNAIA